MSPNDLPIGEAERTGTDTFCTIITAVFALALFVTACIQMNPDNLANMTYPTDSMGRKCTKDNPNYNYLYFTSIKDQVQGTIYYRQNECVCPSAQKEMKVV